MRRRGAEEEECQNGKRGQLTQLHRPAQWQDQAIIVTVESTTSGGPIPDRMNNTTREVEARRLGGVEREEAGDVVSECREVSGGRQNASGGMRITSDEVKVLYQNVGRGGAATNLVLQVAVEEGAAVVAVAEPWGVKGKRKQQAGYEIAYESDDIVIYKMQCCVLSVRGHST